MFAATLPDPLQAFSELGDALELDLRALESIHARYRSERDAGRILANSVEAIRVELTYHSNAIEGCTLTLRETQLVLEGLAPPGGKSLREIYEARNHDRALRMVEAWVAERAEPWRLETQDLLDVHAQILADIDPVHAGRFRPGRVLIQGSRFVPPGRHRFDELIPRLLELPTLERVPPALRAAELHYNLVAVHPFTDGNGRAARIFMNLLLLRHGYPHTIIDVADRPEYLAALEEANRGRCQRFARFVIRSLARSIGKLVGEDSRTET